MNSILQTLVGHPEFAQALFKPVQRRILEKLAIGADLDENEKRYLRGNLGRKLAAVEGLLRAASNCREGSLSFLEALDNYYISGYEALRHNGFGWFYEPKRIVVINTRLKGSLLYQGKQICFVRVKAMRHRKWYQEAESGLKYATNEQVLKDARELKDQALERTWYSMLERYQGLFVPRPDRYQKPTPGRLSAERPEDYGV